MTLNALPLLWLIGLAAAGAAGAQAVYKTVGPDGRISYTDQPPAAGSNKFSVTSTPKSAVDGKGPVFRPGLWEIARTLDLGSSQHRVADTKCTDPNETMAKWDKLAPSFGCQIQPATRKGNSFTQIGQCSIAGRVRHSEKTLTVHSDSGYRLEEVMSGGSEPTRTSVTVAKRVGDC